MARLGTLLLVLGLAVGLTTVGCGRGPRMAGGLKPVEVHDPDAPEDDSLLTDKDFIETSLDVALDQQMIEDDEEVTPESETEEDEGSSLPAVIVD